MTKSVWQDHVGVFHVSVPLSGDEWNDAHQAYEALDAARIEAYGAHVPFSATRCHVSNHGTATYRMEYIIDSE